MSKPPTKTCFDIDELIHFKAIGGLIHQIIVKSKRRDAKNVWKVANAREILNRGPTYAQ